MTFLLTALLCTLPACADTAHPQRYTPDVTRIRAGVHAPAALTESIHRSDVTASRGKAVQQRRPDSVWNGALIGAAAGAAGGYFWARNTCGNDDRECFVRAGPAGVLGGAAIGAAIGAVLDALRR
jgi:hypothetical protein